MPATVQIPNLPSGIALNGTEQFEAVQAGVSVRLTSLQIATYARSVPTPSITINANAGLIMTSQVSGAAAGAGTISNAPKAGNPDFWIPVTVNGTAGWVPWWHA